jgi:four helix bundle protein
MRKEIEARLINLSVGVNKMLKTINQDLLTQNLSKQLIRSSSSAALNYGEAQSAESKNDFVHKCSVVLKELRETGINMRILVDSADIKNPEDLNKLIIECHELTAIFQQTVNTARGKPKKI